jgi:hypothetical protein
MYVVALGGLVQRFLACGQRTPGGPRLFTKLNNFSQPINEVSRKKAKSEIDNFKTHTASTFPLKLKFRFLYIFSFVN